MSDCEGTKFSYAGVSEQSRPQRHSSALAHCDSSSNVRLIDTYIHTLLLNTKNDSQETAEK